jgi:hypothetical protein
MMCIQPNLRNRLRSACEGRHTPDRCEYFFTFHGHARHDSPRTVIDFRVYEDIDVLGVRILEDSVQRIMWRRGTDSLA